MGRRKGRCSRKNKGVHTEEEPDELTRAPHSFVVHRLACTTAVWAENKQYFYLGVKLASLSKNCLVIFVKLWSPTPPVTSKFGQRM